MDLYQSVTDKIIRQLEQGDIPWTKPWKTSKRGSSIIPYNAFTGRRYSGVNVLLLWAEGIEKGYSGHHWLTFMNVSKLKGRVRKGEKGTHVVFVGTAKPKDGEEEQTEKKFLKSYTVFNLDQLENMPEEYTNTPPAIPPDIVTKKAFRLVSECGIRVEYRGNRAFYSHNEDCVVLPPFATFHSEQDFFCTGFHELVHATGHDTRLGRERGRKFGDADYAREELVAELGSAFLCAYHGIEPTQPPAGYIQSWLKVLKEDNRAIFFAASKASKAADWLLDHTYQKVETQEEAEELGLGI